MFLASTRELYELFLSQEKEEEEDKEEEGEHKWSVFGIVLNAPFRFGQNLAGTYYSTLGISLQKNF